MEMNELQEMREQLNILREKLNNQQIVNDHLFRETMKNKVSGINKNEIRVIAIGTFCCLIWPALHFISGVSWTTVIATILIMVFTIGATVYIHQPLHQTDLMSADLASVARVMARFKNQYRQWLHIVCPIILTPWLAWFCYDYTEAMGMHGVVRWYFIGFILFCGFIGFLIGYFWHRKTVNLAQDVIRQIEEE